MQCNNCGNDIPDNRKFCNSSCSASFNNKKRCVSDDTKKKISSKLKKSFPVDEIINLYSDNNSALQISKKYNTTAKTIIAILKEHGVWKEVSNIGRICDKHNTEYEPYSNGRYVCKKCCVENISERRRDLKKAAVEYKGGKCEVCGYNKSISALEFHHKDPNQKDFGIATKGTIRKFEMIKNELDKCIMLCANCHREEHDRLFKNK